MPPGSRIGAQTSWPNGSRCSSASPIWTLYWSTADQFPVSNVRATSYLRTRCLLDQGLNPDAWHEVAHSFQQSAFDEELYQLALEVAQPIDRGWLMEWMQAFRDAPGFAAPVSIVWAVIGNRLNADQYLAIARAYTPEMGS